MTYEHRGDELNHLNDLLCLCKRCHGVFHALLGSGHSRDKKTPPRPLSGPAIAIPVKRTRGDEATGTRILSEQLINSLRVKGGMTKATLNALGLDWSFTKQNKWLKRLRGRIVTEEAYQNALAGKRQSIEKQKKLKKKIEHRNMMDVYCP